MACEKLKLHFHPKVEVVTGPPHQGTYSSAGGAAAATMTLRI